MFSKISDFFKKKQNELIVILLSFLVFLWRFGLKPLNIFETNWIKQLNGDFGDELITWKYYLHSPWAFPFTVSGYDYPSQTGIGMTGIVPIIAVPLKLIHSVVQTDFQHFGWWYALCYVLQGFWGYKLVTQISNRTKNRQTDKTEIDLLPIIVSLFFTMAPTFLFRWGHVHMNAHFLILASLYFYFNSKNAKQHNLKMLLILCLITSAVHQYLAVMVFAISLAALIQSAVEKKISIILLLTYLFLLLVSMVFVFYVVGDFLIPVSEQQNYGFGAFSSNLNTFWNSMGYSKFIKPQKLAFSEQYEGFGYLGAGFLILALFSFLSLFFYKNGKFKFKFSPIFWIGSLIFLYALSKNITLNEKLLVAIPIKDYTVLGILCNGFRSSGRFIWVPYYLIMFGVFKIFLNLPLKTYNAAIILSVLICFQCFELQSLIKLNINHQDTKPIFPTAIESHIYDEAKKLIMYPPYSWNYKNEGDFYGFAYHTSELGIPISTGYYARPNFLLRNIWTNSFNAALDSGKLFDAQNAIVVSKMNEVGRFEKVCSNKLLQSFECNGYAVLVPPSLKQTIQFLKSSSEVKPLKFRTELFSNFLKRNSANTVFLAVFDEATNRLTLAEKQYLQKMGSHIPDSLRYTGSYIGIIHQDKFIFEQFRFGRAAESAFKVNDRIGDYTFPRNITLMSKGSSIGFDCSINIANQEFAPRMQGLNCVSIDAQGNVLEAVQFNTYLSSERVVFEK